VPLPTTGDTAIRALLGDAVHKYPPDLFAYRLVTVGYRCRKPIFTMCYPTRK